MQDQIEQLNQRVTALETEVAELKAALKYPDMPPCKIVILRWLEHHPTLKAPDLFAAYPGLSYDAIRQAIRLLHRDGVIIRVGHGVYAKRS